MDTGIYWVRGDDTCGIYMLDTFIVRTKCDCSRYFFIPNSFTPNGDGQNDVFYPRSSHGETKINYFRIYNRWGELLFEREHFAANDVSKAWDGTYGGNLPMPDVYVYVVEAVCEDGTVLDRKGSVTVIR
jgi:gliding motility-associated-like protein